ncbi:MULTISPECIES: flagellar biosynthetic protein FliO [unclassified Paenibacillus]|uniref:FliO/MopB family protein n=1 Tax=Paenibacillus provencensis TaxID=441151 RepID=A0ABW3PNK4_9BACL|nr:MULTISPECIES: flagellar biosynthetic protein FliO [unclassified Paenibacillus]MCM3128725.1 flagellar biosynthetic protein FliO [Paenibacillus sp. MER 78]SFS48075.1 flagellar protein FliO/FliZ [Paenibacillus sp. 453mf]
MEAASSTNTMETSYYGQLLWVIVVLIAIIAAIVLLVRWLGRKNQHFFQKKAMRVVGGVGLGPSKSIQIVEIGSKLYILGVGEDINVIDTLADPEEISLLMKQFELEGRETTTLFSTIETLKTRLNRKTTKSEEVDEADFKQLFEQKLQEMPDRKEQMEDWLQEDTRDRSRDS